MLPTMPLVLRTLDVDLLQHAVFDDGDAGLARGDVDQDLFGHARASGLRRGGQRRRHAWTIDPERAQQARGFVQRQSHHA